jgi:potassium/hydrogen antiporter
LMVSWVGLRGAAPIVLATFPLLAGLPHSDTIFHLVFFIVLTSVLLQGTLVPYVAKWIKVDAPFPVSRPPYPIELVPAASPNSDLVEIVVSEGSYAVGRRIVDLNLPTGALIILIHRQGEFHVPNGGTVLEVEDRMMVLVDQESLEEVQEILQRRTQKAPIVN